VKEIMNQQPLDRRPSSRKRIEAKNLIKNYEDDSFINVNNKKPLYSEEQRMTLPKYQRGQKFEKEHRDPDI
jgi:hypothetical protein